MAQFYNQFGGGGETHLNAVGIVCIAIAILLLFTLSRKFVLRPVLMVAFLMTMGQALVIGGLHFMAVRIIVMAAWARILLGKKEEKLQLNGLDKAFLLWNFFSVLIYTILYQSSDAMLNHLGGSFTAIGVYFFFRYFCRDMEDVDRLVHFLALLTIILSGCMLVELVVGRNIFAVFGGIPEFTVVRDGARRCQAAFGNAILAGTFGAVMMPLFIGSWIYQKKSRGFYALAAFSSLVMVLTCHSSTPTMAMLALIAGFAAWPLRKRMRLVRWAIGLGILGLHLVMKAPVWSLIARVDVAGGSAQQREALVDGFIRNFWDWAFIGTQHWGSWNWYSVDLDNQYVFEGVQGGLITLLCFIAVLVFCFKYIGRARKAVEDIDRQSEWRMWTLGVTVFTQMAAFMGIEYYDNSTVGLFALFAIVQAATATVLANVPVREPAPELPQLFRKPVPAAAPAQAPAMQGIARNKQAPGIPSFGLNRKSTV